MDSKERVMEFHKDGSFSWKNLPPDPKLGVSTEMDGTWKFVGTTNVYVEMISPKGKMTMTFQVSIVSDELTLSQATGQKVTYQRTKK